MSEEFPYFFVGTFIEVLEEKRPMALEPRFPYFFVGTFIEVQVGAVSDGALRAISLLFRRDFH